MAPLEEIGNRNIVGFEGLMQYASDIVPIFMPMLFFTIFVVTALGSYFAQKSSTGKGNLLGSLATGSYVITGLALILNLIPDLINGLVLTTLFIISMMFIIVLFLNSNRFS